MSAIPLSALATTGSWQNDFTAILPAVEQDVLAVGAVGMLARRRRRRRA
jgi:hypothetical protein